jgi:hypothetical protein
MKVWLNSLFTHRDNVTPDLGRYLAAFTVLEYLFLAAWAVMYNKVAFDMQSFGTGAAAVFASLGIYFGIRGRQDADHS